MPAECQGEVNELENGAIHKGTKNREDQYEGFGIRRWKDGSIYAGMWLNSKADGKGFLLHAVGDCYAGDWKADKQTGFGVYVHINGAKYIGQWLENRHHGKGSETWPDGSQFEGKYEHGKKHNGRLNPADGSWYLGDFVNNKFEGMGTY